eukprot:492896_1
MHNHNKPSNPNPSYSIPPPPNPFLLQNHQLPHVLRELPPPPPPCQAPYFTSIPNSHPSNPYHNPINAPKRPSNPSDHPFNEPPFKKSKPLSAHELVAKQLAMPTFNNPHKLHQSIQVQEVKYRMWLDADIIGKGYDWIQVHYHGFSNEYDRTIYVDPNHKESKQFNIRLLPANAAIPSVLPIDNKRGIKPESETKNNNNDHIKQDTSWPQQLEALVTEKRKQIKEKKYEDVLHDMKLFLDRFDQRFVPQGIQLHTRGLIAEVYKLYSVCLAQTKAYREAIEYIQKYMNIRPHCFQGYMTLAAIYSCQNKYEHAAKQYEMALKQNIPQERRRNIQNKYENALNIIARNSSQPDDETETSESDEDENAPIVRRRNIKHESSDSETESEGEMKTESEIRSKRGAKGTTLDERVMDTTLMSAVQKTAYKNRKKNPNGFYYRFNAAGEKQRNGAWNEAEHRQFMARVMECGVNVEWGFFSECIEGRVGYQCSNYWRKLMDDGSVEDANYVMENKDGKMKRRQLKRKEIEGAADDDVYYDRFRRFEFTVKKDGSRTFEPVPMKHPNGKRNGVSKKQRKKKKKHKKKKRKKVKCETRDNKIVKTERE